MRHGGGAESNFRNKMVDPSHFAMIPRADIPRSVFRVESAHKTTFDANYLVPIYCEEILPGDSFNVKMTAFVRMSTLIFPLMDNLELCSFFFFVPNRLVWIHWQQFMGEQKPNPGSSTSFVVPQITARAGGYAVGADFLADHFGLPIHTTVSSGGAWTHNALPFRAYNLIYNEWFRDENLVNSVPNNTGDGPDSFTDYAMMKRAKRHDYFTSALPFLQKGTAAGIPFSGLAPVRGLGVAIGTTVAGQAVYETDRGAPTYAFASGQNVANNIFLEMDAASPTGRPQVFADLTTGVSVTVNALRQSFQIQRLLERDARGGTRYTEILRAHFGVLSPDARLQRPEYLGGGCTPIVISPVAQTAITGATPQGNLAGVGSGVAHHGFSKSFVEHGFVIGLVNIRSAVTYQQGLAKFWQRSTRYDYYWPAFSHLGEQAVLNSELCMMFAAGDANVFGYQERYAEYRYKPSMITGWFRSGINGGGTIDPWHLAEYFTTQPTLNQTFIEQNAPISRVIAAGTAANGLQFLFDSIFETKMVRLMPTYSVPGFIDHF